MDPCELKEKQLQLYDFLSDFLLECKTNFSINYNYQLYDKVKDARLALLSLGVDFGLDTTENPRIFQRSK